MKHVLRKIALWFFSARTLTALKLDVRRMRARLKRFSAQGAVPARSKLHLGCGGRRVPGWLNVDVYGSEYDVDLACGRLPWRSAVFDAVIAQHLIEHLELQSELLPLLRELHRVTKPGGELWLSCPDIEKICRFYLEDRMEELIADRHTRLPDWSLGDAPSAHMINDLFHQGGEHKNLFDFELLDWALRDSGFSEVERTSEGDLLRRYPEFPARGDDLQSLYVQVVRR